MSLRARLLAASLALVFLGLAAADVATYAALHRFLYRRVDQQLLGAQRTVLRSGTREAGHLAEELPGVFIQLRTQDGTVLATINGRPPTDPTAPAVPDDLRAPAQSFDPLGSSRGQTVHSTVRGGPRYRLHVMTTIDGAVWVVGLPLHDTAETLHRLLFIELLVSVMALAGAAALGIWLVRLGLKPLEDIEETAATITAGDMSGRVAHVDERTEVGRLGRALNSMLDAIRSAFAERQSSEAAAKASEERMRQFVADASHELRTPVAAVRAYAELYRRGADTRPEDLARLLSRIEQEAARMGVLVDDLLLLTRLDEGRPLDSAPVDVGAVADEAVEAARVVEPDRPVQLAVRGSVEVLGDRDRLRQVLDNLLANVRSHTPAEAPAEVRVWSEAGRAVLEVADHGPGLSDEQAAHVFERFYRADAARSRDRGGAGLGLSIVAAIVAAHGGTVTARSRIDGPGSVFRVEIPLLPDAEPADAPVSVS